MKKHIVLKDFVSCSGDIYFEGERLNDISVCSLSFAEINQYLEPLN